MAALEFNIDALKFTEAQIAAVDKPWSEISSSLNSKSKSSSVDVQIPKEYNPLDYLVYLILRDFLQPGSSISLDAATHRILDVFPDGYMHLRSINTVFCELASQIPYYHSSQHKLATLLHCIAGDKSRITKSGYKVCPAPNTSSRIELTIEKDPVEAIHFFYQDLSEALNENTNGGPGDDDEPPMYYVNYQAFLANLEDIGLFVPGPRSAILAMRSAFQDIDEKEGPEIRGAWIMGAAQWILWNGQGLFKQLLWPGNNQTGMRFDMSVWRAWNNGFKDTAARGDFGKECKNVSKRAFEIMDVLEKQMSF